MIRVLLYLICLQISFAYRQYVAKPTVVNSTGEYYIDPSQKVRCNSSISNCFVICASTYACMNCGYIEAPDKDNSSLHIQCSGEYACSLHVVGSKKHNAFLDIECSGPESCFHFQVETVNSNLNLKCSGYMSCCGGINSNANLNSSLSSSLRIQCSGKESCGTCGGGHSDPFVVIGSQNPNSSFSMECSGYQSCDHVDINTMLSNQSSIICNNRSTCLGEIQSTANRNSVSYLSIILNQWLTYGFMDYALSIKASDLTMLNLQFLRYQHQEYPVRLYISSLTNFTNISCQNVDSCLALTIGIPASSNYDFNANVVVNGNNVDKFGYLYFDIRCVTMTDGWQSWHVVDCTNDTAFPIFDTAEPDIYPPDPDANGGSVYYFSHGAYWYRYQTIILDEKEPNINDYYIECRHDHSCSQTFIQFKTSVDSNCTVSCTGQSSCNGYTIHSMPTNNSNISVINGWGSDGSSITAFSGNSLTLFTESVWGVLYINGSDDLSMYIYLNGVFCTYDSGSPCGIYINATNAKVLNLTSDATETTLHSTIYIYGPISEQSTFDLFCSNYGCYQLELWLPNDLNDVNVSFPGDCDHCPFNEWNRTNCIDQWVLHCGNETRTESSYNNSPIFYEYYVAECPNNYHITDDTLSTVNIILISGGSALFLLLILMIVWYKYCRKKDQGLLLNETYEEGEGS
eukprot:178517_1